MPGCDFAQTDDLADSKISKPGQSFESTIHLTSKLSNTNRRKTLVYNGPSTTNDHDIDMSVTPVEHSALANISNLYNSCTDSDSESKDSDASDEQSRNVPPIITKIMEDSSQSSDTDISDTDIVNNQSDTEIDDDPDSDFATSHPANTNNSLDTLASIASRKSPLCVVPGKRKFAFTTKAKLSTKEAKKV